MKIKSNKIMRSLSICSNPTNSQLKTARGILKTPKSISQQYHLTSMNLKSQLTPNHHLKAPHRLIFPNPNNTIYYTSNTWNRLNPNLNNPTNNPPPTTHNPNNNPNPNNNNKTNLPAPPLNPTCASLPTPRTTATSRSCT